MVNKCCLVFPNQLFKESKLIKTESHIFLVEEYLFFKQYKFHKQKILFHRGTMKYYEKYVSDTVGAVFRLIIDRLQYF